MNNQNTELGTGTPTSDRTEKAGNIVSPDGTEEADSHGAPPAETNSVTDGRTTPPHLQDAIEAIESYEFDPGTSGSYLTEKERITAEEEAFATALVMFSPQESAMERPKLRTESWPYAGAKPNPISIGTAKKLLAAAYSEVPCEMIGTGVHGYAWIIEDEETWQEREGTTDIVPPTQPQPVAEFSMKAQWEYAVKARRFNLYNHLVQEGKAKLVEWFGKEMFVDLHRDGVLPNTKTPKELVEHLNKTYALPRDYRRHMEQVEKEFNESYDPRKTVEHYFMQLQDARTHAKLLGQPYTDRQSMNKALQQFEKHYEKESIKAEKKWNERKETAKTWTEFKTFWKAEIHQFESLGTSTRRQANQAVDLNDIVRTMSALEAETKSLREDNSALQAEVSFQRAFRAERNDHGDNDSVSTITNFIEGLVRERDNSSSSAEKNQSRTQELLHIAKNRDPKVYKNLNGGQGKRFTSYCWKCGCNCTHWTRKCIELSSNERQKYRDADFDNLMGGSTHFLDRRGKYQAEFAFDSL